MKLKKDEAQSLLVALGFKGAAKWAGKQLKDKIEKLALVEDLDPNELGEHKKLCKAVLKALKADEDIEIVDGEEKAGKKAKKEEPKKAAKSSKKSKKDEDEDEEEEEEEDDEEEEEEDEESDDDDSDDEDEDDDDAGDEDEEDSDSDDDEEDEDEEDEDEDEEEEKPKKKKGKDKPEKGKKKGKRPESAGKDGGPGVIQSIVEFLKAASKKAPISKKDILAKLQKRFPDREPSAMKATINVQVPSRLKAKFDVGKNDDGYWLKKKKAVDE